MAFAYLRKITSMQKKNNFDFLSLAALGRYLHGVVLKQGFEDSFVTA